MNTHSFMDQGSRAAGSCTRPPVPGIPVATAMPAPAALAVRVAEAAGVALIGFVHGRRRSVCTHPERIRACC